MRVYCVRYVWLKNDKDFRKKFFKNFSKTS